MTYLEIVNDVLKRLRESSVASVSGTDYSALIGVLVNDAKREIENAHTWNTLRTAIPVTTAAGAQAYTLTGSGERFVFESCLDSSGAALTKAPVSWIEQQTIISSTQADPAYFCFSGVSSGDTQVKFFNIPGSIKTYNFVLYVPQADLTTEATECKVPGYLVAMNAYARAIAERGEDAGSVSSEAYAVYQKALSDAIAIERNRYEEDINWEAM